MINIHLLAIKKSSEQKFIARLLMGSTAGMKSTKDGI